MTAPDNPKSLDIPPHTHTGDVEINQAIATALGERKVRLSDHRLLIIFAFVAAMLVYVLYHGNSQNAAIRHEQQRFEKVTAVTCSALDQIAQHYDSFLTSLRTTVAARTDLPPEVKQQLIDSYNNGMLGKADCSKLTTGKP